MLLTASTDSTIKIWVIPESGILDADMVDYHADLCGHRGSLILAKWNPTADFTIASAGADCSVKVWDVENQ